MQKTYNDESTRAKHRKDAKRIFGKDSKSKVEKIKKKDETTAKKVFVIQISLHSLQVLQHSYYLEQIFKTQIS